MKSFPSGCMKCAPLRIGTDVADMCTNTKPPLTPPDAMTDHRLYRRLSRGLRGPKVRKLRTQIATAGFKERRRIPWTAA